MRMNLKTLLMASAALAAVAAPAVAADSYFYRSKPVVEPVRPFSFDGVSGKTPGAVVESAVAKVSGYRGRTALVSGGEYQVCSTASCSDQGSSWKSAPTVNLPAEFYARVRTTAPAFGQAATARLTVGDASAEFQVASRAKDTTPAALSFAPVANAELNQPSYSAAVAVTDHDGVTLSVSGGGYQVCSTSGCSERNGQAVQTATSAEVASGTLVRLVATPTAFGQPATVTLTAGNTVGTFTATGRAADTDPDPVTFAATANATAGQAVDSPIVRLTGHDGITVSASNASFRICTTADCSSATGWLTSSTTAGRDTWAQLRATAPAAGTTISPLPTLSYGGRTATWSMTSASGGATYAAMGLKNSSLTTALTAALGGTANWIQCSDFGVGGTESCAGASQTLVVFTDTELGTEFGVLAKFDLRSNGSCWTVRPGFYFTTAVPAKGYIFDAAGTANGNAGIEVCAYSHVIPLYNMYTSTPRAYSDNGSAITWRPGFTLTGGNNDTAINTTVKWYKRR